MPPPASSMTIKRIHREIADLKKEDMGGMSLTPAQDSLFTWSASIPGPSGSPYEGGIFKIAVELAPDYPFSAPKITFVTRIYHMNISDRGSVCLDVLKHNWSPALSLYKVLLSISSLLTDPNPKDPLVPTIANAYVRNRTTHDNTAREWTRIYALPPKPTLSEASAKTPANAIKTKAKGKGKTVTSTDTAPAADTPTSSTSVGARRTSPLIRTPHHPQRRSNDDNEAAVISIPSDSESDSNEGERHGRCLVDSAKRAGNTTKRKRPTPVDGEENSTSGARKRRSLAGADTTSRTSPAATPSRMRTLGDVIVIDD